MKYNTALAALLATENFSSSLVAAQVAETSRGDRHVFQESTRKKQQRYIEVLGKTKSLLKNGLEQISEDMIRHLSITNSKQKLEKHASSDSGRSIDHKGIPDLGILSVDVVSGITPILQRQIEDSIDDLRKDARRLQEPIVCPGLPEAKACNCASDCFESPEFCACAEGKQCCQDFNNQEEMLLSRPIAYGASYACKALEAWNSCEICEITDLDQPETGMSSGAYSIEMDCPGIPSEFSEYSPELFVGFEQVCSYNLCESCIVDVANSQVYLKNCSWLNLGFDTDDSIIYNDDVAPNDEWNATSDELEDMQDGLESFDLFKPIISLGGYACTTLEALASIRNQTPMCKICRAINAIDPKSGLLNGSYGLEMDCPGVSKDVETYASELFVSLEGLCSMDLCESCNVDAENFRVRLQGCVYSNNVYYKNSMAGVEVKEEESHNSEAEIFGKQEHVQKEAEVVQNDLQESPNEEAILAGKLDNVKKVPSKEVRQKAKVIRGIIDEPKIVKMKETLHHGTSVVSASSGVRFHRSLVFAGIAVGFSWYWTML